MMLTFISVLAKLVPLAYGIKKLQISTVVEDDKVSFNYYMADLLCNYSFPK